MPSSSSKRARTVQKHRKRPDASSKHSVIEKCPIEIWAAIFGLACNDGGFTGRSLSLVSRYINATSKSYKHLTLAVGQKHFRALALTLKRLPFDERRVRHLFVHNDSTEYGFFNSDLNRLLILVAPTLQTLEVRAFSKATLIFPFPFPTLVDLTIGGFLAPCTISTRTKICYPALKRLHISCLGHVNPRRTWQLAEIINKTSPQLTHLRISSEYAIGPAYTLLRSALNAVDPHSPSTASNLPPTVRMISFKPPYNYMSPQTTPHEMVYLRRMAKTNNRFFLLKMEDFSLGTAKQAWLETCAGGRDWWYIADEDLDLDHTSRG